MSSQLPTPRRELIVAAARVPVTGARHGQRHESAVGFKRVCCSRLMAMTEIRPAANADSARWLLRADVDWWDLVRYGPPGFDVYVRIAFPRMQMVSTRQENSLPFA